MFAFVLWVRSVCGSDNDRNHWWAKQRITRSLWCPLPIILGGFGRAAFITHGVLIDPGTVHQEQTVIWLGQNASHYLCRAISNGAFTDLLIRICSLINQPFSLGECKRCKCIKMFYIWSKEEESPLRGICVGMIRFTSRLYKLGPDSFQWLIGTRRTRQCGLYFLENCWYSIWNDANAIGNNRQKILYECVEKIGNLQLEIYTGYNNNASLEFKLKLTCN